VVLQRETDQARSCTIHDHGRPRIVCMTARLDVTPKTTEQNRIVRTSKSEAEVTNNKKLRSRYCTIEATKLTTDRHEASRGLFVLQQSYLYYLEYGSRPIVSVHVFVHLGLSLFHKKICMVAQKYSKLNRNFKKRAEYTNQFTSISVRYIHPSNGNSPVHAVR